MISINRLGSEDWERLRDVRLLALADAPHAFWATLEGESRFNEQQWRNFLSAASWWIARREDETVGVVAMLSRDETTDEAELIALWVAPAERRSGIAARLVRTACQASRSAGTQTITLWVTENNDPARQLYEGLGFDATGERANLPQSAATGEIRMMQLLLH